jgi:cation diffusion facilitator CzcD-associated flavoprotein CzcO
LRRDCIFGVTVEDATWDDELSKWIIQLSDGSKVTTRFFLPNTGFAAKRYMPDWPGVKEFKGTLLHPSHWPVEGLDLKHKKIAIIGTGSTGVQLFQGLASNAEHIVLFQRTPNLALPMKQVEYANEPPALQLKDKTTEFFKLRRSSYGGFDYNFAALKTFEHTPEQRRDFYEELWEHGDFHFWLATYNDMLFDDEANTEAYNFWYVMAHASVRPLIDISQA